LQILPNPTIPSIVDGAGINPANDRIFLRRGQGGILRHCSGLHLLSDATSRTEYFGIGGQRPRPIGAVRGMTIGLVAKSLYERIDIVCKTLCDIIAIDGVVPVSGGVTFAAGKNRRANGNKRQGNQDKCFHIHRIDKNKLLTSDS
jgi:hypothetical protein